MQSTIDQPVADLARLMNGVNDSEAEMASVMMDKDGMNDIDRNMMYRKDGIIDR
jgi:hypothetical protein